MNFYSLLQAMLDRGGSDLFVTAGVAPSLKVNGVIQHLASMPLTAEKSREVIYGIMNADQRQEFEANHECNFSLQVPSLGRFRANVFQHQGQAGMVLRRIETNIPGINELNLPPIIEELAMAQRGLILVVGATGMGKSTTMAAMVGHRNSHGRGHILTIEDPIEFLHQSRRCIFTQREVGVDTDSFEIALINALRQAPDVIMLGEIRTREAMEHVLGLSETGHLCLSTLHAGNAIQALERIIRFFPKDRRDQLFMELALNLKAIVAQRLVPKADGTGRSAALELLINTPMVSDLIHRGDLHLLRDTIKRSRELGMSTFDQAVFDLYSAGTIGFDTAIQYADSANEVRLMIKLGMDVDPGSDAGPKEGIHHLALEEVEPELENAPSYENLRITAKQLPEQAEQSMEQKQSLLERLMQKN